MPHRSASIGLILLIGALAAAMIQFAFPIIDDFSVFMLFLFAAFVGALFAVIGLIAALLDRKSRRAWLAVSAVGVLWVLALPIIRYTRWPLRQTTLARVAERAEPLVQAINKYVADKSAPPATLDALVPEYLAAIPETGVPLSPQFEYGLLETEDLVFYDLGSRNGAEIKGLVVYNVGEWDQAALVVEVDDQNNVLAARAERMHGNVQEITFDAETWRNNTSARMGMVRDLAKRFIKNGAPVSVLLPLIGVPDGRVVLSRGPWELVVRFPHGIDTDRFYYWPSEQYPKGDDRIAAWAYFHD
jgi:hypothetical protein